MQPTNFEKISKFEVKLETSLPKNRLKKNKKKQEIDHTKIEHYLQQLVYEQLLQKNMVPVGIPTYKLDIKNNNCNLIYQTKINLLTAIDSIEHIKTTKPKIEIPQEMIDSNIDAIKTDTISYSVVKEHRSAVESDFVNLELEIANDLKINQSVLLNKPFEISNLLEIIIGMKQNEAKTANMQLPNTLKYKKYAGKKENIKITVKQILTYKLPAMNDTFSKSLGFDDVINHLVNIISELTTKQNKANCLKIEKEICDQLEKKYPVEISEQTIQEFKIQLESRLRSQLTACKWSVQEIDEYLQDQSDNILEQTKKELVQNSIFSGLVAYFKQNHNIGDGYNFANLKTANQDTNATIKHKIISFF